MNGTVLKCGIFTYVNIHIEHNFAQLNIWNLVQAGVVNQQQNKNFLLVIKLSHHWLVMRMTVQVASSYRLPAK